MGQLRFCLRADLSPSAYGSCQVDELKHSQPQACDVLLVVKARMADANPTHVICMMSAQQAASLRMAFEQPSGIAGLRDIGDSVRRNITNYAPRCQAQGAITQDGAAYLMAWSRGQWTRRARPTSYSILRYRPPSPLADVTLDPRVPLTWQRTSRWRTHNVRSRGDESDESASEEEDAGEAIQLAD